MDRKSWGLSVGAVFFHGIFLVLSFLLMPECGDALLIAGMVAGGAFFLLWGIVGWRAPGESFRRFFFLQAGRPCRSL